MLYTSLNTSLDHNFTDRLIDFNSAKLEPVSKRLFSAVEDSYGCEVLEVVADVVTEHKEEMMKLARLILPEMRTVLARQDETKGSTSRYALPSTQWRSRLRPSMTRPCIALPWSGSVLRWTIG